MIRESLRGQSRTRTEETKQVQSWSIKESGDCTRACKIIESVSFCRFSSVLERWLRSLVIRRRPKVKHFYTNRQSPWRIVQLNRRITLSLQDEMIHPSVVIICSGSWISCLLIPVCLLQSKTRLQKAFPLNAGALSLWHSLPQLGYGMLRVPRDLDPALIHFPVLDEFFTVSDQTIILVVQPLESFISAY